MGLLSVVSVIAGALLLLVLVYDVFATVFVPRGGAGPVTERFYAGFWSLWRRVGDRMSGSRRRRVLAAGGPLLLPLTVAVWAVELVLAFALLFLPYVDGFTVGGERALHPFLRALYVSGFSATTLGVGDVFPQSATPRLLTVVAAGLGFALFSASIAYVLSVYGALLRSTSLALEIARFIGISEQQDGVDVLLDAVRHQATGEVVRWLGTTASHVVEATQAEAQYPLTAYFHVPDDDRALAQSLAALLELLTVARTLLDPEHYPELTRGRTVSFALRCASAHVTERAQDISTATMEPTDDDRRDRHDHARARLERGGVALRPADASRRDYVDLRKTWDVDQRTLRSHFGYPPGA